MKITKRIIPIVLAVGIASAIIPAAFASGIKGDANSDGAINSADALKIRQYAVGTDVSDGNKELADINGDSAIIPTAFSSGIKGDANSDGAINSADALKILQYAVGTDVPDFNKELADINGDSTINSADALMVLQISVGTLAPPTEEPDEKTPLTYTKAELVEYYNKSLEDSYAADKLTIKKSTNVSVTIDKLSPSAVKSIANSLIKQYAVPTEATQTFANGVASDKTTAEAFLVPTKLEPDGAKSVTVTKTDKGYKVVIVLVDEKINYDEVAKYNAQASLPLPITDDLVETVKEYGATVSYATLDYTGTVLTAEIDPNGKILTLNHTMPLKIAGAGKYNIFSVSGEGGGTYTLDALFTY